MRTQGVLIQIRGKLSEVYQKITGRVYPRNKTGMAAVSDVVKTTLRAYDIQQVVPGFSLAVVTPVDPTKSEEIVNKINTAFGSHLYAELQKTEIPTDQMEEYQTLLLIASGANI